MLDLVWITVIGFAFGNIARLFIPPKDRSGTIWTELVGIVGAVAAAFLMQLAGWFPYGTDWVLVIAGVGAFLVLFVYGMLVRKGVALAAAKQ